MRSDADCIVFYSPHEYRGWVRDNYPALRALGKPLVAFVSECIYRNPHWPANEMWHREHNWFDFYACAQASDAEWMRDMGYCAEFSPLIFSDDLFNCRGDERRKPKFVHVGVAAPWKPERRQMIEALRETGLVDFFETPRTSEWACAVAEFYRSYAGVLCLPSHGRGQSIRLYEAAACGALIVERQDIDVGGEVFKSGTHRVEIPQALDAAALVRFLQRLDFDKLSKIARDGRQHAANFAAGRGFDRLLAMADTALASK